LSYDLVILTKGGEPDREVRVPLELHQRLLELVQNVNFPLLSRLKDYYEDTEISRDEIPEFLTEVDQLLNLVGDDVILKRLLLDIRELAEAAIIQGKEMLGLAD